MRNMEDGAEGDILTLLSANPPLPCCCHRFTLRGVQGGAVAFKPTVNLFVQTPPAILLDLVINNNDINSHEH